MTSLHRSLVDGGYLKVELRNELDPSVFWQVHRSTIVNANAIAGVSRDMFGHINLKLKRREEKLNVSESHAHLFRQM